MYTVAAELHYTEDYILYEMDYRRFMTAYDWICVYKFGYTRKVLTDKDLKKRAEQRQAEMHWRVWDEENGNTIDYMETEEYRYTWSEERNMYVLPRGK